MPNLKDLKTRISSVKSTRKITRAMRMVAASKLKRAQERAEAARPYSEKMERMLAALAVGVTSVENAPALLTGRRDAGGNMISGTHLFIVATSDRGLCGGFNSSIVRVIKRKIVELEGDDKKVKLAIVGRKGWEQLKHGYEDYVVQRVDSTQKKQPEYADAADLASSIIDMFNNEEIDSCSIVYNKFVNAMTQQVTFRQLIPLDLSGLPANDNTDLRSAYEYEPGEEAILAELLPRNIAIQIFHGLLENAASEQGARMTAMDNATRNAGEMIDRLTLTYNRTRQAAITSELIEIISGAEAL